MSTPEDVLSTIQAIPAALRAFQTGRERIYAAVLEANLGPEVFRVMLAIVNAPDHNECPKVGPPQVPVPQEARDSARAEWDAWGQKVRGFFRCHARGAVYPIPSTASSSTQMKYIVRLYFCLCKFVHFFPSYVKFKATPAKVAFPDATTFTSGHRAQEEDHESPRLTDTELLRLRRGLLRYELWCRLIGVPSFAADCDERMFSYMSFGRGPENHEFWNGNSFRGLLPMDEVEEIVCASAYVADLYASLHGSLVEDSGNAILEWSHDRVEGVLDRPMSGSRKETVEQWVSFGDLEWYPNSWCQGQVGIRLGLVFLDRVIQSTLADRRELLRTAFHTFRGVHCGPSLKPYWGSFHEDQGGSFEFGPYCNPMVRLFGNNVPLIKLMERYGWTMDNLRKLGWVFFDDLSMLRSLGLPLDAKASWFTTEALQHARPLFLPEIPESAWATILTEDEWMNFSAVNYFPKDRVDDFEAMTRFVAGARAVVDLTSNQLPRLD